jgi:hypothetical protein
MKPAEQRLYERICNFKLDEPGAIFPFSHKLSWEYRWSEIYSIRVIQEYKKFVFLAMVADHVVSPSVPVDRVWHLHLLYTHSYWDKFCGEVLNKPLHHSPSLGGREEGLKYHHLYECTLATYRNYFGTPPSDIWNDPRLRSEPTTFQWLDPKQYWILPQPIYWLKDLISQKFSN